MEIRLLDVAQQELDEAIAERLESASVKVVSSARLPN